MYHADGFHPTGSWLLWPSVKWWELRRIKTLTRTASLTHWMNYLNNYNAAMHPSHDSFVKSESAPCEVWPPSKLMHCSTCRKIEFTFYVYQEANDFTRHLVANGTDSSVQSAHSHTFQEMWSAQKESDL
jgi:hypothetical protein